MDVYPLDLILAVATASATIFLGFLPTKTLSSVFFARETLKASLAWMVVAILCPPEIMHYPLILAVLCLVAWWQFRENNAFSGKLWLSLASGLGISVGVMLILAVTPSAYPPGLPLVNQVLLLASIYLGGAVTGLAYSCLSLVQGSRSGVPQKIIQRYVGLLFWLVLAKGLVFLLELLQPLSPYNERVIGVNGMTSNGTAINFYTSTLHLGQVILPPLLLFLVILSFFAKRATSFSSRVQPTRFLIGIIVVGFLTEILARLLVL
jgi:hypothetical protein